MKEITIEYKKTRDEHFKEWWEVFIAGIYICSCDTGKDADYIASLLMNDVGGIIKNRR